MRGRVRGEEWAPGEGRGLGVQTRRNVKSRLWPRAFARPVVPESKPYAHIYTTQADKKLRTSKGNQTHHRARMRAYSLRRARTRPQPQGPLG